MAIKKQVIETNGIVTEYHRIALIQMEINQQNTILIHSYLSEDGRQIEKDYANGKYNDIEFGMINWPYVNSQYINCDYDGDMTISKAYEWLKSLPEYDGAEDI